MPWLGFLFLMTHMSISHIKRQIQNDPSVVDVTGAQMVLLMKLSAFCWNIADGQIPEDQLSDFQKERSLKELPSILDYTAYVMFFPSLLAGPAFDYVDYQRWIDTTMFDVPAGVDPSKKPPSRKKRRIPRSGTPALFKAVTGLIWVGLFVNLAGTFNHEVLTSDSYMQKGFLNRVFFMYTTGVVTRLKYYGVWTLTEGACILAGLGYNGIDAVTGKVSWNRLQNIDPIAVETAQNPRAYLGGWNMNTNHWLRNYVYLRVTPRGKKPGFRASMITFATSALWHGFYPGYYLTFILASLIQTSAKSRLLRVCLPQTYWANKSRFPPPCPALFPGCQHGSTDQEQEVLRLCHFPGHANHFWIYHHAVLGAQLQWLSPGVVPCLLLRPRLDGRLDGLLRVARKSFPQEATREATRKGACQARAIHQHGQPHRWTSDSGHFQGSREGSY